MARFSIIVPLWGSISRFDETLASVLRNRPANSQIVIPYSGHYDDPYDLAKEVDFCQVNDSSNQTIKLATLLNLGLSSARAQLVAIIRPGVQISENWEAPVESSFADAGVGSVAPILVDSQNQELVVAAGVEVNRRFTRKLVGHQRRLDRLKPGKLKPVAPTTWAGFYRKSLLTSVGGFDETVQDNYCDVDLGLALNFLDFKTVPCQDCVMVTDAAEDILDESQVPHGLSAQRALARFTDFDTEVRIRRQKSFAFWDALTSGFKWSKLRHAYQRLGAEKHSQIDQNHRELLNLLLKQRDRLSSPALHLKVATVRERHSVTNKRKAA